MCDIYIHVYYSHILFNHTHDHWTYTYKYKYIMYTYIYIYSTGLATTEDLIACRSPWRRKVQDQGDHQALPGGPAEIVPVCSLLKTIASVKTPVLESQRGTQSLSSTTGVTDTRM